MKTSPFDELMCSKIFFSQNQGARAHHASSVTEGSVTRGSSVKIGLRNSETSTSNGAPMVGLLPWVPRNVQYTRNRDIPN